MWFGMMIILFVSLVYSIKYLSGFNYKHDIIASEAANVGIFLGILGLVTGMVWERPRRKALERRPGDNQSALKQSHESIPSPYSVGGSTTS
jgi:hypothetical protein